MELTLEELKEKKHQMWCSRPRELARACHELSRDWGKPEKGEYPKYWYHIAGVSCWYDPTYPGYEKNDPDHNCMVFNKDHKKVFCPSSGLFIDGPWVNAVLEAHKKLEEWHKLRQDEEKEEKRKILQEELGL